MKIIKNMGIRTKMILGLILLFISVLSGYLGYHLLDESLSSKKTERAQKENASIYKPKLTIMLFPAPMQILSPSNKYPFHEYTFSIQNTNKESADVIDCSIKFFFPNIIDSVVSQPLIVSGEGVSVGGVRIFKQEKDGVQSYEEQPTNNPIANSFSLEVEKTRINKKNVNTNIVLFACSKWPKNADFAGIIIVDQSKKPNIVKSSDSIGSYFGTYYYVIDGKTYREKISGEIKPIIAQSIKK